MGNLVVPSSDNTTGLGITWSPGFTTTGATLTDDGATNTATIVASIGAGTGYAAGLCEAYAATGGYTTGWFLPAKDQLNCIYTNRVAIGAFGNPPYWSSSEVNANEAWGQFGDGSQSSTLKNNSIAVRCARGFTS